MNLMQRVVGFDGEENKNLRQIMMGTSTNSVQAIPAT